MPPIGALIGNTDFSQLRLDISKVRDVTSNAMHSVGDMVTGGADPAQAAAAAEPIYWNYGAFIQQCVDFTILALCVFLMVKLMNRLMKKKGRGAGPRSRTARTDEGGAAAHRNPRPAERTEEISGEGNPETKKSGLIGRTFSKGYSSFLWVYSCRT